MCNIKSIITRLTAVALLIVSTFAAYGAASASEVVIVDDAGDVEHVGVNRELIRASEISNARTLKSQSQILGRSIGHGLFVEIDGDNLVCKNFELQTLGTVVTPVVAGKKLFASKLISDRFVRLKFGISCELHEEIQTEDTNHDEWFTNVEYLIWDLAPGANAATFKIESADFTSVDVLLNDRNNHEQVLVREVGYTVDGDHKRQNRYRFYNLVTRSFCDLVVFDFNPAFTTFYTKSDEDGNCIPVYASQSTPAEQTYKRVVVNGDGKFTLQNTLFSKAGMGKCVIDVEDGTLILYSAGPGGFVVPSFVDLKRARPAERPLLTDDELDTLTSNLYDASVTQGVLSYTQHFGERQVVMRELGGAVGPRGRLLKALYDGIKQYADLHKSRNVVETLEQLNTDLLPRIWGIVRDHPDAFPPSVREGIARLFNSQFIRYAVEKSPINVFASRIKHSQSGVLRTADGRFDMPIYYTMPARQNPRGWFIVDVRGGPHAREFNELDVMQQFFTSRDLPYFRLNIRGSTGFGADYRDASNGKWWEVVDDIGAAIEWIRGQGLGAMPIVTGGSFGGYAAAAAYAKGYTNYAIATNGLYDLNLDLEDVRAGKTKYSQHDVSDQLTQFGNTEEIRRQNSVTTHLTPRDGEMLIFTGLKDDNCLPNQSQMLFDAMNRLGNKARMITMAEEGHSPNDPANLLMMLRVQEELVGKVTGSPYETNGYATIATTPGAVSHETRAAMGYGPGAMVVYGQR